MKLKTSTRAGVTPQPEPPNIRFNPGILFFRR
jgi:hypothetical protein